MTQLSDEDIDRIAAAIAHRVGTQQIDPEHASQIAAAAARTAVQEMGTRSLAALGIDLANAKHVENLKANMNFIQSLRVRCDRVGQSVSNAIANAVTLGLIGLIVIGFLVWARGWHAPPTSIK